MKLSLPWIIIIYFINLKLFCNRNTRLKWKITLMIIYFPTVGCHIKWMNLGTKLRKKMANRDLKSNLVKIINRLCNPIMTLLPKTILIQDNLKSNSKTEFTSLFKELRVLSPGIFCSNSMLFLLNRVLKAKIVITR